MASTIEEPPVDERETVLPARRLLLERSIARPPFPSADHRDDEIFPMHETG